MADGRRVWRERAAGGALAVVILAVPRLGPFDGAVAGWTDVRSSTAAVRHDLEPAQRLGGVVTADVSDAAIAHRTLELVNELRRAKGLADLVLDVRLVDAAAEHAADQASRRTMSHDGSDQSSAGQRIAAAGVASEWWGENVAFGYGTPENVVDAWMRSAGHRAMLLSPRAETMGVAVRRSESGVPYWTQTFAGQW